jgi:hypothetical protein
MYKAISEHRQKGQSVNEVASTIKNESTGKDKKHTTYERKHTRINKGDEAVDSPRWQS